MKLQSCGEIFFYIRRGKRKKSLQMQHMISTWGCRNSEFISREGNKARRGKENQEPERKERVRGGGRGTQRGKERGSDWRERRGGKSKKKLGGKRGERERERSERADTTCGCGGSDPVMEGDKFSGKTNSRSSQLRGAQLLPSVQLDLLLFCDRDTFLLPSAFPPSVVFSTCSFWPVCWLHAFWGIWSWKLCRAFVAALATAARFATFSVSFVISFADNLLLFFPLYHHILTLFHQSLENVTLPKWHKMSLSIQTCLLLPHSSLVWKQERALFEQYYSCPMWLFNLLWHFGPFGQTFL